MLKELDNIIIKQRYFSTVHTSNMPFILLQPFCTLIIIILGRIEKKNIGY